MAKKRKEFLAGYKTYVSGALIILSAILYALGLIDHKTFMTLIGLFSGTGLVALRKGVEKAEK